MADLVLVNTPLAGRALPGGVCPSLSNVTLGSYVSESGGSVALFDPSVDIGGEALADPSALLGATVDGLLALRPRTVGVSALSPVEGRFAAALARRLKARAPGVDVVVGGIWASACADELLQRVPEIDGVVVGPGEDAALQLASAGEGDRAEIPGLVWRDRGLRHNAPGRVPRAAPPLALDLLLAHPERYDIFCWLTSRGCPFHCVFCTEALTSPEYFRHALGRIGRDIQAIEETGQPWYVWICDPLFGADSHDLEPICQQLRYNDLSFLVESRVDVLRPWDVPRLKQAGCDLIYFGLESGCQTSLRTLEKIGRGPARYKRYIDGAHALVAECLRHDVLPVLGVLDPVPGATMASLEQTLALLRRLAALPKEMGIDGIAPCFHAFPLRVDRGSDLAGRVGELIAAGVTFDEPDDLLFGNRFLAGASADVGPEAAAAFRAEVRALNSKDPRVTQRLWRSFPRPYVEFEV